MIPCIGGYSIDFKEFSSNYKLIRKQKDENLGEISLMKNKRTNLLVEIKEETIYSEKDLANILNGLQELLPLNSQISFNKFMGFSIKKNQDLPYNKIYWTIFMIYEHFPISLEKQILNKLKIGQFFSEKNLWDLLKEILNSMSVLHTLKRKFADIKANKVFISDSQAFKLFFTNYHTTAIEKIKKEEIPFYNCLLAPEQLFALFSKKEQGNLKPDELKSEIFTLALLILQVGALENKEGIYDISSKVLNFDVIERKLSKMRSLYSHTFCELISQMLTNEIAIRPNLSEIFRIIHENFDKYEKDEKFENLEKKNFSTPPNKKQGAHSSKKAHLRMNNTSFDSALLTFGFQNHLNSEEKILNESKSTKRTDKTTISFQSKEIYFDSSSKPLANRDHFFEKIKEHPLNYHYNIRSQSNKNPSNTPEKLQNSQNFIKKKLILKPNSHNFLSKSQDTSIIRIKPDFSQISQNVRLLEKQLILDSAGSLKPGILKKIYTNGSIYLGFLKKNKREGKGIYYFSHYEIYGGEWLDDKFHGKGVYLYDNGDRYEGQLRAGAKQGKGIYYYVNGDKYDGDWGFNMKQGLGIFYYANNERFEGIWTNNEKNGKGIYYFLTGDKFEGMWIKGKKHGKGIVYFSDKSIFEGVWIENTPSGFGVLKYGNGDIFKGNFSCGIKEGEGIYIHKIGGQYTGDWKNDERNGKGVHMYSNGDKYIGLVFNGERVGNGEYQYVSGEKYIGDWKENLRHGNGKLILSEKSYYEGEWKDGKREGFGIMIYDNGEKYEGLWMKDRKNGRGFYQWCNGTFYHGDWKEDNMNGEGMYLDESGLEISGVWNENELCE